MKTCPKCNLTQERESFTRDRSRKDGLSTYCKPCEKAKLRKYYFENASAVLEKHREWHSRNRDQAKKAHAAWLEKNPDYYVRSYASNPTRFKAKEAKRRALKTANGIFNVSDRYLARLYQSACLYCGSRESIQADHVLPLAKGGRHSIGNLVAACKRCNASKNDDFLMVWKLKQSLRK